MESHVRNVGWLLILAGSSIAVAALIVLVLIGGFSGMLLINNPAQERNDIASIPLERLLGAALTVYSFLMAPPMIIAGRALLQWKSWGRVFAMMTSALYMLHIPIGTLIGIYALWVLNDESCEFLFDNASARRKRP